MLKRFRFDVRMKKRKAKKKRVTTDEMIDAILKHPRAVRKIEIRKQLKDRNYN